MAWTRFMAPMLRISYSKGNPWNYQKFNWLRLKTASLINFFLISVIFLQFDTRFNKQDKHFFRKKGIPQTDMIFFILFVFQIFRFYLQ